MPRYVQHVTLACEFVLLIRESIVPLCHFVIGVCAGVWELGSLFMALLRLVSADGSIPGASE